MNLKIGIVGLPNAGKSTLFNALLKKQVADCAPYPFCTIEPNVGVVPVPDARLAKLAEITKEEEHLDKLPPLVPAVVEFVDIAGLVKGASKGEGLGNKFLSHIREVDIICHVIRNFSDPTVVHVAGEINPLSDRDVIEMELLLADLQTIDKQQEPRGIKDRDIQRRWELVLKLKEGLNNGHSAREILIDEDDRAMVRDLHLLSMKPTLFVINVDENELSNNQIIKLSNNPIDEKQTILICAKTEAELSSLPPEEQKEYLTALGVSASGLDLLIQKAYQMLGLISFLTTGEIEARAWTIVAGTKAPQAAGVIHTDFEKKFIKAEVVSFEDFVNPMGDEGPASTRGDASSTRGGWKGARENGRVRQEGKEYIMKDGDVVEFKIGA